jgi:hypothetical protein
MDRADALRLLQAMTDVLGDGDEARILIAAFFRLEKIIQATDPDAHLMLWMLLAIAHTAGTKTVFDATDALRHADQALIGHAGGNKSAITRRNKQAEEWADQALAIVREYIDRHSNYTQGQLIKLIWRKADKAPGARGISNAIKRWQDIGLIPLPKRTMKRSALRGADAARSV